MRRRRTDARFRCEMSPRIPCSKFATIRARAAKRKGGDAKLVALLPKVKSAAALARIKDDSMDVVACLRDSGLDIPENPSSRKDLRKIQDQFNAWARETELPLTHLSRICAMSIGENYDAATLHSRANMAEGDAP